MQTDDVSSRQALGLTYALTFTVLAGLLIGGVIVGSFQLEPLPRTLLTLGWSCVWMSAVSVGAVIRLGPHRTGLTISAPSMLLTAIPVGLIGMFIGGWLSEFVRWALDRPLENPQIALLLIEGAPLWATFLIFIFVAIIQPVAEEVIFRGAIFSALNSAFGSGLAVVGSSILFGLMHGELSLIIATAFLGAAFGILRIWSGSVYPCCVAHAVNNGFAFIILHQGQNL